MEVTCCNSFSVFDPQRIKAQRTKRNASFPRMRSLKLSKQISKSFLAKRSRSTANVFTNRPRRFHSNRKKNRWKIICKRAKVGDFTVYLSQSRSEVSDRAGGRRRCRQGRFRRDDASCLHQRDRRRFLLQGGRGRTYDDHSSGNQTSITPTCVDRLVQDGGS